MTQFSGGYSPPHDQQSDQSTTQVAKDEAAEVARTAAQSGSQVAGTAGEQASRVASETAAQARNLLQEGRGQLTEQAREGQRKAAGGLRTLADQLQEMAEKSGGEGMAPEVVRQASERTRTVASWLEDREPGDLLDEVRRFARRKPGVFLAGAALAGVVVGRLTRGVIAAQSSDSSSGDQRTAGGRTPSHAAPPVPTTPPPPPAPPMAQPVNPAYGGGTMPMPDQPMPGQPGGYGAPAGPLPPAPPVWEPQPGTPGTPGYPSGPVTR